MKALMFFCIVLVLASFSPGIKDDCDVPGEISGWDATRCACCGGWRIEADGHSFLTDSIPNAIKTFGQVSKWDFPVPVWLSYKPSAKCPDTRIDITCIRKRRR
jgi:hypothetical protein